jgi:hypothetical protein
MEDVLEVYARPRDCLTSKQNAAHGPGAWPVDIARLLLMLPNSRTLPPETNFGATERWEQSFPDLDDFDAGNVEACPASGNPILPLRLSPQTSRKFGLGLGRQNAQPLLSKREKNPTGQYAGKAQAREAEQRYQREIE